MNYNIRYSCICHIGNCRSINQDNFTCDNQYLQMNGANMNFPLCGVKSIKENPVFGVFDGLGGEDCGEVASYIAARIACDWKVEKDPPAELSRFCQKANIDICNYASENGVFAMGTTAAMLAFTNKGISLCNIGDSKIFRFCDGILEQISKDHVAAAAFGVKPPLSQNLGIPPTEMLIDPYLAQGVYNHGDIYLICSDGLTDMVTTEDITQTLKTKPIDAAASELLQKALKNGGRDNITIILCEIQRKSGWFFAWKR